MKKTAKGLFGIIAGALAGAAIFKYFQNKQAAEEIVVDGEDVTEVEEGTCECGCCCANSEEETAEEQPEADVEDAVAEETETAEE